jgi:hypothetical protein
MGTVCIVDESSSILYNNMVQVTRRYNLHEYATRYLAEGAILTAAPLVDSNYSFMTRKDITVTQPNPEITDEWEASVTWEEYIPPAITTSANEVLSGSITVTSQLQKTTFSHVGSYGPGGSTPNFGGLINDTGEGGVEGANIDVPVLGFNIKRNYTKGTFNLAWLANAASYVGLPNNATWRGFGIGEVKLIGVDGSNDSGKFDVVTFNFAASPSFTNIIIPSLFGNITVPSKLGWQYLHVQYDTYTDPATGTQMDSPYAAHVDELQPGVNLSGLI